MGTTTNTRARLCYSGGVPVFGMAAAITLVACAPADVGGSTAEIRHDDGDHARDGGLTPDAGPTVTCERFTLDEDDRDDDGRDHGDRALGATGTRVRATVGSDHGELAISGRPGGPSQVSAHVSIAGVLEAQFDSTGGGAVVHVRTEVASEGVLSSTADATGLIDASFDGRALDVASDGTRYADGTPVVFRHSHGSFADAATMARYRAVLDALVANVSSCLGDPPPPDPASCALPPQHGLPPGVDAGDGGCFACLGLVQTGWIGCAVGVAAACGAFSGPFIGLCFGLLEAACFIAAVVGYFGCLYTPGGACCPHDCGSLCCPGDTNCVDARHGRCGGRSCEGTGLYCPMDNTCYDDPGYAGSLSCEEGGGNTEICCPPEQSCGAVCCHGGNCGDSGTATCCNGPRPDGSAGPCPGTNAGEFGVGPAACCADGFTCAGDAKCCLANTQCTGTGRCCPKRSHRARRKAGCNAARPERLRVRAPQTWTIQVTRAHVSRPAHPRGNSAMATRAPLIHYHSSQSIVE